MRGQRGRTPREGCPYIMSGRYSESVGRPLAAAELLPAKNALFRRGQAPTLRFLMAEIQRGRGWRRQPVGAMIMHSSHSAGNTLSRGEGGFLRSKKTGEERRNVASWEEACTDA